MSRGMRQKLGLLLALAHDPRLLVLDEPTSALDPLTQDRLNQHLRGLAERGHTVLFSSHVLSEVEGLCERVAIIKRGRLVANEALDTLRRRAGRAVTIRWGDGAPDPSAAPPFLTRIEHRPPVWTCALSGAVPELLDWLQGRPVQDLEIGPPDLDSLFMNYYRNDGEDGYCA
jgi:ABC-2 type transport system ATP-binding protein